MSWRLLVQRGARTFVFIIAILKELWALPTITVTVLCSGLGVGPPTTAAAIHGAKQIVSIEATFPI